MPLSARSHVFRAPSRLDVPCEEKIFAQLLQPGMVVLDVGCGAAGRSTTKLRRFTSDVWACDVNREALRELRARVLTDEKTRLVAADMVRLPFRSASFDLVLVALCGLDYLLPEATRIEALRDIDRVLREGGHCVFSSLNRLGVVTSPRDLRSRRYLRWRLRHVVTGGMLRRALIDLNGLRLRQSTPRGVIRQVLSNTGMRFRYATDRGGVYTNLLLLSLFCAWPYYVFVKPPLGRTAACGGPEASGEGESSGENMGVGILDRPRRL